jgi:hypothetical protein
MPLSDIADKTTLEWLGIFLNEVRNLKNNAIEKIMNNTKEDNKNNEL